tara:strand:+ start:332 stop:853 length:522 start_codon:yes stop_codon:yes gene_type:complete
MSASKQDIIDIIKENNNFKEILADVYYNNYKDRHSMCRASLKTILHNKLENQSKSYEFCDDNYVNKKMNDINAISMGFGASIMNNSENPLTLLSWTTTKLFSKIIDRIILLEEENNKLKTEQIEFNKKIYELEEKLNVNKNDEILVDLLNFNDLDNQEYGRVIWNDGTIEYFN